MPKREKKLKSRYLGRSVGKLVFGITFALLMAGIDFSLIRDLLLQGNNDPFVSTISSVLFVIGLDGGPFILGMMLMQLADPTMSLARAVSGKIGKVVALILSSLVTVVAFIVYFIMRFDVLSLKVAEFTASGIAGRYEGYYADMVLIAVPVITSLFSFIVGIITSSGYLSTIRRRMVRLKRIADSEEGKYVKEKSSFEKAKYDFWSSHNAGVQMPDSEDLFRSQIISKIEKDAKIVAVDTALKQQISDTNTLFAELRTKLMQALGRYSIEYISPLSVDAFDGYIDVLSQEVSKEERKKRKELLNAIISDENELLTPFKGQLESSLRGKAQDSTYPGEVHPSNFTSPHPVSSAWETLQNVIAEALS